MVFGHIIFECMEFRRASFVFFMPRGGFGGPGSDFGTPRSTFWPGDALGSILGSRKTYFCEEMILWWGYKGIPPAQMNSMVPGIHMGRLLCPKTLLKIISKQIVKKPENWCRPLAHPCGLPYSPWWLSLFPPWGRQHGRSPLL